MKNIILKSLFLSWTIIVVSAGNILAQCAMCRASVETNVSEDGIGFAAKLNTGILYLFAMPYLLAIVIGYMWYKKSTALRRMQEEAYFRKQRIAKL